MENYVTLVYLPEDSKLANFIADMLEEKHIDVHLFEHIYGNMDKELEKDIRHSAALIIVQEKDAFDYREFLRPIMKADNRCQIIAMFKEQATYQNKFSINEIKFDDNSSIESYVNTICCLIVGGYHRLIITPFNRQKYRKKAIELYNKEHYVWSLTYFLKVFTIDDTIVKERIAKAYRKLLNNDLAINYYSICLPDDNASKASICNELGVLYTQTHNLEFAEKYLKDAIDLGNTDALYNLGYLYETKWSHDSRLRKSREGFDIYCQVLNSKYTSEKAKARAATRLRAQADKLMLRRNFATAMNYYKALGDGSRVAECLRNIKMIRLAYEAKKKGYVYEEPVYETVEETVSE